MDTAIDMTLQTMEIPCKLNRASLGEANYVFAVITDVFGQNKKVAWVPREDVTIVTQPLKGTEIIAKIRVKIVEEENDKFVISLNNDGVEEIIAMDK